MQTREPDRSWIREDEALYDPFHLAFICKALQDVPWMEHIVFGSDSHTYSLLPDKLEQDHPNPISELFSES
jgi:hypothetical protein